MARLRNPGSVIKAVKDLRELVVLDQADQDLSHAADAGVVDYESVRV